MSGSDVPSLVDSFQGFVDDYDIPQQVVTNLNDCGYTHPTPVQMQAIPIMAKVGLTKYDDDILCRSPTITINVVNFLFEQGQSLMVCAPTGSGKTAAFLVPIIKDLKGPEKKGFRAVILCPTRELAKQTQRECLRLTETIGLRAHIISKINQAETKYGPKSNKQFDILITTPNRICYLLSQEPCNLDLST